MQNFKQIFDKVLMDTLSISQEHITPDSKFKEDLGVDSLDMVELVMEFEKEFTISIPDESVDAIITVADAENYIRVRVATTKTIL
jgi:acyl carrier protein